MKTKKILTKVLSIALVCVMLVVVSVSGVGSVALAGENRLEMNENEILKAYAASRPQTQTASSKSASTEVTLTIDSFIKLYSPDGDIIAYYVEESNGQYAVVNSLVNNPIYLEFGNTADSFDEIKTADKVYYLAPGDFATHSSNDNKFNLINGDREYSYDDAVLLQSRLNLERESNNPAMKNKVAEVGVSNENSRMARSGEGETCPPIIVSYPDLPGGSYSGDTVSGYNKIEFNYGQLIYGEIINGELADNYCGSVAVFNVLQYYRAKFNDKIPSSEMKSTHIKLHKKVGNGWFLPTHLNQSFTEYINDEKSYALHMATIPVAYSNVRTRIANDQLLYFVTINILHYENAHYFIGYGYTENATSGKMYIRVMDGWSADTERYYLYYEDLYQMGYIYLTK